MSSSAIEKTEAELRELEASSSKKHILIDFNPENTKLTQNENVYIGFLIVGTLFLLAGFGMIIYSYIQSNQNVNMILKYEQLLQNRTFEVKCWKASNQSNPCNESPNPAVKLFNWQMNNYFTNLGVNVPCLEIQNRITLNNLNRTSVSMTSGSTLFTLGPLVFPNVVTTTNGNVNNGPQWLQSGIRMLPNTHFNMDENTNLYVSPNNIYGIQIPVVNFNNNIATFGSLDYCQASSASVTSSDANSILNRSPIFMYYNTHSTTTNASIPSFTICTCLMIVPPNVWKSMCIPGNNFTFT